MNKEILKDKRDKLRQKVGQFLWICNQSRADISFDVSNIASNINKAKVKQRADANKSINKINANPYSLRFRPIDKDAKFK